MPANRAAILAALRGARCEFHAPTETGLARLDEDRDDCTACDEARADAVLAAIQPAEPLRCKQCGGPCEEARRCYATPVCYSCLPPPPALPVRPTPVKP